MLHGKWGPVTDSVLGLMSFRLHLWWGMLANWRIQETGSTRGRYLLGSAYAMLQVRQDPNYCHFTSCKSFVFPPLFPLNTIKVQITEQSGCYKEAFLEFQVCAADMSSQMFHDNIFPEPLKVRLIKSQKPRSLIGILHTLQSLHGGALLYTHVPIQL